MNKFIAIAFMALMSLSTTAVAQSYIHQGGVTTSRYPEYQRVYEEDRSNCYEVVTQDNYNVGGSAVGAIVGYVIGREIDRDGRSYGRGYSGHRGYVPGRGGYYQDRGYYYNDRESRLGRYGGAVAGAVIGGNAGRGERVQRVCERSQYPNYREILVGYRVVTRYSDGTTREYFERVR